MNLSPLTRAARTYAAAVEAKINYQRLPKAERVGDLSWHDKVVRRAQAALLVTAKRHGSESLRADRRAVRA